MAEIALACARRGDFKGMAEVCRGILSADPGQPDALHCLGLLHRRTGNLASAIHCHERLVRGRPGNAEYRNALGVACRAAGRLADAIEAFEGALRIDPGFVDAYVDAGRAYFSRGDFRTAVASNFRVPWSGCTGAGRPEGAIRRHEDLACRVLVVLRRTDRAAGPDRGA